MAKAIEAGIPRCASRRRPRAQARIDSGQQPVIGVNTYVVDDDEAIDVLKVDNAAVRATDRQAGAAARRARRGRAGPPSPKLTAAARSRTGPWRPICWRGNRGRTGDGDGRRDPERDGGGLRSLHRPDPYDRWRVFRRGRRRRGRQDGAAVGRGVRGGRGPAPAPSSPRWARMDTTAGRRSSRRPSPTSVSMSTWARSSRPRRGGRQAVEADVHIVGVSSLAAGT